MESVAWGVRECRAERLGAADVNGDPGIRGPAGAEAVFTGAQLRGVNPTNRENVGGPALSPRPGRFRAAASSHSPYPHGLTPSDDEALMAHATEQIGLALATCAL